MRAITAPRPDTKWTDIGTLEWTLPEEYARIFESLPTDVRQLAELKISGIFELLMRYIVSSTNTLAEPELTISRLNIIVSQMDSMLERLSFAAKH